MAGSAVQNVADVGRPPAEQPKSAILNFRVHPEVRDAVEQYARQEHRTLAAMADLLVREAVIARRKRDKESAEDIESLP